MFDIALVASAIGLATPILLGALGGILSERAGVINIGIEGMMLSGAFAAFAITHETGSPWLGVLGSSVVGAFGGLILAIWSVTLLTNQIVVGLTLNLIAAGLTTFLYDYLYADQPGGVIRTPAFSEWAIPGLDRLPGIGTLFVQSPVVIIAFTAAPVLSLFLFRSAPGLAIRAVGERARAADSAGINVRLIRYVATMAGGAFAGVGGSYLSLVDANTFRPNMTAGRGYIALAVVLVAAWRPNWAIPAALVFGGATAFQFRAQETLGGVPSLTWTLLPYIVTLIVLIALGRRLVAPGDDGRPYIKEQS